MNTCNMDDIIHFLKKTILLRHNLMLNMVPEGKITYNSRIVINRILLQSRHREDDKFHPAFTHYLRRIVCFIAIC